MKSSQTLTLLAGILFSLFSPALLKASIVGKTKEDIIAEYGKPSATELNSQSVILRYPEGAITLVNGKVASYIGNFGREEKPSETALATTQQPLQASPTPKANALETPPFPSFLWNNKLAVAQQKAEKYDLPILALFTGPDWCPPCIQLENEVFTDNRFKRFVEQRFIPLKVALYRNSYQQPAEKAQYEELSSRYGNRGVPAFYILSKEGDQIAKPDIFKRYEGATDRTELIIAAIEQADGSPGLSMSPFKIVAGLGILLIVLRIIRR
ncbi:thioredoxin family protein [Puniceicoccaceae bacterium K14]|nr:thioredoxin family protein [Puniceicoccaceae bacterium K14]